MTEKLLEHTIVEQLIGRLSMVSEGYQPIGKKEYLRRICLSNQGICYECIVENHKQCSKYTFVGRCRCDCQ